MQQVNRGRGPLQEINREPSSVSSQGSLKKTTSSASDQGYQDQCNSLLQELHKQLASVIATNPASKKMCNEDEVEDPKASPMVWVSKWVDYSDKYGFGYALCDESIGKIFKLFVNLSFCTLFEKSNFCRKFNIDKNPNIFTSISPNFF